LSLFPLQEAFDFTRVERGVLYSVAVLLNRAGWLLLLFSFSGCFIIIIRPGLKENETRHHTNSRLTTSSACVFLLLLLLHLLSRSLLGLIGALPLLFF
jgi:hypothetical protein